MNYQNTPLLYRHTWEPLEALGSDLALRKASDRPDSGLLRCHYQGLPAPRQESRQSPRTLWQQLGFESA